MTRSRILIVDDEPFNVDYLEQELADLGYETITAVNGADALDKVRSESPDLILLDIMMPVMDGFEVLARLKAAPETRDIPVIVISAASDVASTVRGIRLGAEDLPAETVRTYLASCPHFLEPGKEAPARSGAALPEEPGARTRDRSEDPGGVFARRTAQCDGWEIAAYFAAAREVAGDFYDAFCLGPEEQICLVIADVCDKGVGAALFMTLFRSLLRFTIGAAELFGVRSPAEKLERAVALTNNYIAHTHGHTNMFATVFIGSARSEERQTNLY